MKTTRLLKAFVCILPALVVAKPGVDQQIAFLESSNSSLLLYPTQFTQGIVPKPIHSHNDCEYIRRGHFLSDG